MIDRLAYLRVMMLQLRYGINATQKDLAEELGVHPSTYCGYECGRHIPDVAFLIKLCKFYDVSLNYLFGYSENN